MDSSKPTPRTRSLAVGLAALLLLGAFCAVRLRVTSDVTTFLAALGDGEQVRISRRLAESDLNRGLILTVRGPTPAESLAAAAGIARRLKDHPQVAWLRAGPPEGSDEAVRALYFPRRFAFFSDRPETIPAALSDAGLREAARELKRELSLPTGVLVKRVAAEDPLLAFPRRVRTLARAQEGALQLRDGGFLTRDGEGVVFLESRTSAFDTPAQQQLQTAIDAAFAAEQQAAGGTLRLERSGVAVIALASERSIRADITRISTLSTLGVVALFLLLFGSLRALALGLLTLGAGCLTALAGSLLIFGEVHGITLAFGGSLIGVCIDYAVHLLNHHALDPEGAEGALERVWPGLLLGALTTVAGFTGLMVTPFPGVREIAAFGVIGVLGALAATRWLLPPLLPARAAPRPLQVALARHAGRALAALSVHRRWLIGLPLAVGALAAVGLPRAEFVDDPKALYAEDPGLAAERDRVRDRVSRMDGARFVLATGPDLETALQRNDAAALELRKARADGLIEDFRSLHTFLWSADLQRRSAAAVAAAPDLPNRLRAALVAEGFRPEPFAEGLAHLAAPPPEPLGLAELEASPLGEVARRFVIQARDGVLILTTLRGVRDGPALGARVGAIDGVTYFDQNTFLSGVWRGYRLQIVPRVGLGLLAVLGLIAFRYRRPRLVISAFLPAVLAAVGAVATLGLFGVRIHLLHVVALLLVLSIGADYGIFLVESARRGDPEHAGATLLSIGAACLTTVLAFGLLALSPEPVLRAIGLTTGVGVVLSLLLAPTTLVLVGDPTAEETT